MDLKDFIKEIVTKLDRNNIEDYKKKAAELVFSSSDISDMSTDEIVDILNGFWDYDELKEKIFNNDDKLALEIIKKAMKSDKSLNVANDVYLSNKRSFTWFNDASKKIILDEVDMSEMSIAVFDYMMNDTTSRLYFDSGINNPLFIHIEQLNKKIVEKIILHKNFEKLNVWPVFVIWINDEKIISTQKVFNKLYSRIMRLLGAAGNGQYPNRESDFEELITSKFLKLKHIHSSPTEIQIAYYEYAVRNKVKLNDEIREFFYEITGDEEMLPQTAKDIFVF